MSNTETFYNELHAYVQQVANQIVDLSGGNSVVTGVVTQALGTYYTVKLTEGDSGSSVKAVTVNNNLNLSVNESVYLIKANGTLDSAYYILGRVESIQEAFLNLTLAERFQNETEIDATYRLNSLIQDEAVLETLRAKGAFQIGGTFTCSKANTEDYGVRVHLYRGNTLIKTYELNTHYFIGQPFKMMSMPQSRTVQLDETTLKSGFDAIKIETFGQDFTYNEVKLSVGFLLNVDGLISVDVTVINDKDYFSKHNSELANNVHLKAEVTYEGQDFSANSLQYYWMIKDDTITSTHEQYLEFVGEGWRCLNSYSNVSALNFDKPLQLWNCRTNEIILNDSEQCPQFINTLKCVIKYQQLVTESEEFTIYNYNKESFSAKVEASVNPALLILKTDSLTLSCLVENANKEIDIKDYAYKYQWYDSKGLIEGATQSSLNIITGEGFNEDTNSYGMLAEDIELTETFYCMVRTYQSNEDAALDNVLSVETSNFFQVISKVAISAELKSPTYYKYYISNSPYCTFEKAPTSEDNLDWNGDWVIRDPDNLTAVWAINNLLAGWDYENETPIAGHQDSAAYNYINNLSLENGQYIYLTKKMLWHEEKLGRYTFLREENWSSPLITKGKTEKGIDIVNAALEKLNTFNQLTEGGLRKGLLYNEENGNLYINADFINTGALTVADDEGKKIFYADVDQQKVEAGGFTVDNTSIRGRTVGISSNINQENDPTPTSDAETGVVEKLDGAIAFWAGATYKDRADAPFKVTHNGILYATGVKITELNQEVADRIAAIAAEKSAREQAIEDTKTLINDSVTDLQNQLDGEITTWFYEGEPTLENEPASNWVSSDEEMEKHIGDLYYDTETQYCYRWTRAQDEESYGWEQIADTGIVEAMTAASEAKGIADSKRQIFYREKFNVLEDVPDSYDINDMIVVGQLASSNITANTQFYICTAVPAKGEGRSLSHWTLATDIATSKEVADVDKKLTKEIEDTAITLTTKYTDLVNSLETKLTKSLYFEATKLTDESNKEIPAIIMKAKNADNAGMMYFDTDQLVIKSDHLMLNHNGSKYKDGYFTIDTNNFTIDESGNVTVTGTINATSLNIGATQQSFDRIKQEIDKNIKTATDAATSASSAASAAQGTADQANTAAQNAQQYAEGVSATVSTLTNATLPATYLGVNTTNDWIYIKSKTENSASPGKIFFDADALIINSDNLKVNVKGDHKVTVKGALEATSLTISQEVAKEAGLGSQVSDNLLFDSAKEVVNQYSAQGPEFVQSAYNLSPVFKKYGLVPYTLSFDLQAPVAGSVQIYCQNGNGSEYSFSKAVVVESINTWKRYKVTFTPYKVDQSTYTSSLLVFYGEYNTGRVPRIRNIKLELGDTGLLVPPWSPAVEESAAPNENLAVSTALSISGKTDNDKFLGNKFSLSLGTNYSGVGVRINSDIFKKPGTFSDPIDAYDFESEYVLSFKYREVNSDGAIRTGPLLVHYIGGHASWFTPTKIIYTNNGNQYHETTHANGSLSWAGPTPLPGNLNGELYIRAYFRTHSKANCSNVSDWNLYIQPGRPSDVYAQPVYCEIWDVKVEKGTIATGWQVAKKDTETFFNVDPSTGNITLKAANSLSLTGDKFEITSGKFQVSTTGKVTATDLHVSQGTIADWSITPELQVYGTVGFHDLVSGGNGSHTVTKWNSLYTGGITSSHLYALSTNGLQVEYVDEDADYQRQVISFTWPQLAKTLLKCVGIKSGQVVIPAGKKEWVFTPAFTTSYGSLYRVICTPSEKFSSADIMTSAYWEYQPNGNTTYYVGRKRDSGDDYSTTIEWIAIPISVFGFHYDSAEQDNMKLL